MVETPLILPRIEMITVVGANSSPDSLSDRDVALLRAVAAGRAEITHSCEPDLFIDGLAACDQTAVKHLAHAGLIRAVRPAKIGRLAPAQVTDLGAAALTSRAAA